MVYVMTDFTENNFKFWAEHPVSVGSTYIIHAVLEARESTVGGRESLLRWPVPCSMCECTVHEEAG